MTTPEAKFALFSATAPKRGTHEQNTAWTRLCNGLCTAGLHDADVQILGPSAALLTLPAGLPILCQCVEDVSRTGIHYTVRLFDQPLLSFAMAETPKE